MLWAEVGSVEREEEKGQVRERYHARDRVQKVSFYVLLALLVLLVGYTLWSVNFFHNLYGEYEDLIGLFTDRKRLRALVLGYGKLAPLVFVVLQVTQVVISFIPGEATGFLGGFLFGVLQGFVYSSIGLSLGSLIAFGLSRWLGLRFLRGVIRPDLYRRFGFLEEPRGILAVFLLFLIPGFPKDTLSYILGVSPIPLWAFFLVMTVGRMPGTWLLSIQGAKFQAEAVFGWIPYVVLGSCLLLVGYLYRRQIMEVVRRHRADSR